MFESRPLFSASRVQLSFPKDAFIDIIYLLNIGVGQLPSHTLDCLSEHAPVLIQLQQVMKAIPQP